MKSMPLFLVTLFLLLAACGPKPTVLMNDNASLSLPAAFDVTVVTPPPRQAEGTAELANVAQVLRGRLLQKLQQRGLSWKDNEQANKYMIVVTIESYAPGNSLGKFFLAEQTSMFSAHIVLRASLCSVRPDAEGYALGETIAQIMTSAIDNKWSLDSERARRDMAYDVADMTFKGLDDAFLQGR